MVICDNLRSFKIKYRSCHFLLPFCLLTWNGAVYLEAKIFQLREAIFRKDEKMPS